jgi:hypothetical protein
MKKTGFISTLCLSAIFSFAQEVTEQGMDLQRMTDEMVGYQDEDADYEDLYENLLQTLSTRYDLNQVSGEELKSLHLLTDLQVENFLTYRKEQGFFLDVYELQVIPGFDLTVIARLLPFINVSDPASKINQSLLRRILSPGHTYVVTRYERTLEKSKGSSLNPGASPFEGSPDKLYFRIRSAQSGDYSIGLTAEKDAGENLSFKSGRYPRGFDFTSLHFQLQNKGKLKNILIGDFQTQFGQGLVLGGAFGLGKGGESVSTTRKSNLGFLPYTSINETAYQRGVALTVQAFRNIRVSAFYSRAKRDASLSADTALITGFRASGLHRSRAELDSRKKITEQNFGLVLHFEQNRMDAGVILNALHFSVPVKKDPTLYNQMTFAGDQNLNAGFFLNYRMDNLSLFSEAARSVGGGSAAVAGLLMALHPRLDVTLVYRSYATNFYTFYSNAFSESTQPQNERGIYWGWKYRWSRKYNITGYVDLFTFPWLGFRRYAPSVGSEWLMRANYQPSKKVSVFIQLRTEKKSRNLSDDTNLYRLGEGTKRNLAINADYGIGENIRLKSRLQYSHYLLNRNETEGLALVQDLTFAAGPFRFTGRHGLFETDNHDNRQYVYESDAWMAYSLPSYSGVGVRNFALIEYKVNKKLTLWARYARIRVLDAEIGSGPEAIAGNTKNDVKFQARFTF